MWELDCKESWALKNWCFWPMVLEKILESPLDCKEITPVSPKGNQSWIYIGSIDAEAPILWPPDTKDQHIGKDPDAGKDCGQEEKGAIEDEMVEWHHWLNGHEFERTQEDSEGQEAWSAAVHGVAKSGTQVSNWTTTTRKGTRSMGWIISSFNRVMRMGTWGSELWNITQRGRPNDIELFMLWK